MGTFGLTYVVSSKNALESLGGAGNLEDIENSLVGSITKVTHSKVHREGVVDVFEELLAIVRHESKIIERIVVGDE